MAELSEKQEKEPKKFESLSPKPVDSKLISVYLKALKEGLDDKDVKNFALTGSYGSGKSSIIRSFQEKYKDDYDFLNISLAEFKWENNENTLSEGKEKNGKGNLDKLVELSVLQQIFYKVKPVDVPDSRVKRIRNISNKEIKGISFALIVWSASTFALTKFNYINSLNPSNWSTSYSLDWAALIFFTISVLGLFFLLKKVVRLLYNTRINKINVKGVELGKELDESILNKHLDEILYFFERTPFNVVVVEDLDRHDELDIFTKLREINYLINNSQQVINTVRSKVTFLYAVKDEILKEKDRTKFFDLVIPVIPFINNHNSSEKLREKLLNKANADLMHPLTGEFIDDVSLFIDDMRLLINICNEYEIYKEQLNKNLKQNNLLAAIVYKNMKPLDFAKLHNRDGKIYSLLSRDRKAEISNSMRLEIKNRKEELKNEISKIENEKITDVKEINAIYLNEIRKSITHQSPSGILIGDENVPFANLEQEPYFQKLDKSKIIRYTYNRGYNNANTNVTFSDIETRLSSKQTYEERIQNIRDKEADEISEKEHQIDLLDDKENRIRTLSLKSIFKEFKSEDFLKEEEKSDRLMLFFLRNGFIDENYYDYISYFHGVSLSPQDNEYLISVKSESSLSYDFELKNIKNVIKRIQPRYFENRVILNFDLINFILKNKSKYRSQYDSIFKLLTLNHEDLDESRVIMGFVNGYLKKFPLENKVLPKQNNGRVDILLNEICKRSYNVWGFVNSSSGLSEKDKKGLLNYILSVVNDDIIIKQNSESIIANYISSQSSFLSIPYESYQQKFGTVIQKLKIKFKVLDEPNEQTKKLFDFVYENNYYEISDKNIALMMKEYGKKDNEIDKERYNFTDIVNSSSDKLLNYIEGEINEYLKYSNNIKDAYIEESEESIIRIYNNKKLREDIQSDFLRKEMIRISDLSKINAEGDYPNFFELNKLVPNWNNISLYFSLSEKSIDEILKKYLNIKENYEVLSMSKIEVFKDNQDDDLKKDLSVALIKCNGLSIQSYVKLLKSITGLYRSWNSIGFEKLTEDKVLHLITNRFLSFTESNFDKIEESYSDLLIDYLVVHQDMFATKYDSDIYSFKLSHKEEFFVSENIKIENKIRIFEKLATLDFMSTPKLAKILCDVLANYEYSKLGFNTLNSLFAHSESTENRIKLFNLNYPGLVASEFIKLLNLLPHPYNRISGKQNKPRIPNSHVNLEFVKILKSKLFISSYRIIEDEIRVVARY